MRTFNSDGPNSTVPTYEAPRPRLQVATAHDYEQ